jgi:anti-anti-sigma factor
MPARKPRTSIEQSVSAPNGECWFLFDSGPADIVRLQSRLLAAVGQGYARITLDLRSIVSLDITALRALISLLRIVRKCGADLTLAVAHPDVRRTLAVTALDKVFTVVQCEG